MVWLLLAGASALATEWVNGVDDDGDGLLPVVELDCDDDGAFARPPVTQAATVPLAPALYGLADCRSSAPVSVVYCFGAGLSLTCGPEGLWSVDTSVLESLGVMVDGVRVGRDNNPSCAGWDCDDQCPDRCEGAAERCDGRDNDCVGAHTLLAEDVDGVPDTMVSWMSNGGFVATAELDQDADGAMACTSGPLDAPQTAVSWRGCVGLPTGVPDCNDTCSPAYLGAPVTCDGFVVENSCDGLERDALRLDEAGVLHELPDEGDGHRTCGYRGSDDDPTGTETFYVLVRIADGSAVPLVRPRPDARACDAPLRDALAAADLADGAFLDQCIAADTCRQIRWGGHTSEWPADCAGLEDVACGVVRIDLAGALWETPDRCEALGVPEQGHFRTVWSADRIVAARRLVADWECYRAWGTFGCADRAPPGWASPYTGPVVQGGFVSNPVFFTGDRTFDLELWRFGAFPAYGMLAGCWSEPGTRPDVDAATFARTGGDCDPLDPDVHRDAIEGPHDAVAVVAGQHPGCGTCRDDVDNDCDGFVDLDDEGCAPCVVPFSCGGAPSGDVPWWAPLLALSLLARRTAHPRWPHPSGRARVSRSTRPG